MRLGLKIGRFGASIAAAAVLVFAQMGVAQAARNDKAASFVIDYATGEVLHADNADAQRHPASLTKMMTLYMAFEAVEQGRLKLDDRIAVSEYASEQSPTKLGLKAGSTVRTEDAIMGLVTKSANDAAVVIAEHLGGSESGFARQMTQKARRLGMPNTTFKNASGLPDNDQVTTARDMVALGRALIRDFPQFYPLFSTRSFTFAGRAHANHNHLMSTYDGMDGIKTGFIRASGFNLVASAKRGNRRLVASVFGGTSPKNRDDYMAKLLDRSFGTEPGRGRVEEPLVAAVAPKPAPKPVAVAAPTPVQTALAKSLPTLPEARPEPQTVQVTPVVNRMGQVVSNQPIEDESDRLANAKLEVGKPFKTPAKPVQVASARMVPQVAPAPAKGAAAQAPAPAVAGKGGTWIIQVGSFSSDQAARVTADRAKSSVGRGAVSIAPGKVGGTKVFRSRLSGFDETAARAACQVLMKQQQACVALGPNSPML
ncbi:serine hydrolase [Lacibacterium aquatile]|uniref:Serine hydrolase n=1 Tax=Lacibacterium aquatile TaxID=1168082 RepID=A0ABW5DRK3_9PROT